MRGWPGALLYAAALALVAGSAVGLRSRELRAAESPLPSVRNAKARGAKALFTYLAEAGEAARILDRPFTELPGDAEVLVALAPTRRRISQRESDALEAFVERGHTLVYAAPRQVRRQAIDSWLTLSWIPGPRPAPLFDVEQLDRPLQSLLGRRPESSDPTGAQAQPWLPSWMLEGVRSLRVAAEDGLETGAPQSAALAGASGAPFALSLRPGRGQVLLLAGSDLAENRRLALGDNLQLWANLVHGRTVYFDEYHHRAEEAPRGLASALGPLLAQLSLCAGALALALGRRFGVARPLAQARRRSQGEYVAQLAQLYARSRADAELCAELHRALRRRLFDRLAISAALDEPEVARRLEARTGVTAQRYLDLARRAQGAAARGDRRAFLELSREYARLERDAGCA